MKRMILTALISAFIKDQRLIDFARALARLGVKTIYSSKGTAEFLNQAGIGIEVLDTATLVGGGPILGHRVVTLSREVHAGLLAQYSEADMMELAALKIPPVDLVYLDFYPLAAMIAKADATLAQVLDKMDIGGPTMASSGSKGQRVTICDPNDRDSVISWMEAGQPDHEAFVEALAAKADFEVAKYRMLTATYRSGGKFKAIFGTRVATCKYGENAYQAPAELFSTGTDDPLAISNFKIVGGTSPSFNNTCDVDRLLQTMTHVAAGYAGMGRHVPFIALGAKHGNCCGAYASDTHIDRIRHMMEGDKTSIFGGLVMTNFPITVEDAESLAVTKLDGVIAPEFEEGACTKLERKHGKCRFITNPGLASLDKHSLDTHPRFRYVRGGFLTQPNYTFVLQANHPDMLHYGPALSHREWKDLILAWAIGSTSNSNTITLVKDGMLIANAVGQQSRVDSAGLAIERAKRQGHDTRGSSAYSDSFFPYPDAVERLIKAGVKAIFASKAGVNVTEVINLCEENEVALRLIPDEVCRGFYGH